MFIQRNKATIRDQKECTVEYIKRMISERIGDYLKNIGLSEYVFEQIDKIHIRDAKESSEEYLDDRNKILTRNIRENLVEYLEELQKVSGTKMSEKQRVMLIIYAAVCYFELVDPTKGRDEFNNDRDKYKKDWKKNTLGEDKNWAKDFTAHHIVKLNVSGDNVWWNILPMTHLEHTFMHESQGNLCYKIFECNSRVYSFDDAKLRISEIVDGSKREEILKKVNRDYKIMKDLKCKDVEDKYTREIGYYLQLIIGKGYTDVVEDILREYGDDYKLVTADLVKSSLEVDNEEFSLWLINEQKDMMKQSAPDILVKACSFKRRKVVNYILGIEGCPKINQVYEKSSVTVGHISDVRKRTIFDYACTSGDIEIINSFVRKGATLEDIHLSRRNSILDEVPAHIKNVLKQIKRGEHVKVEKVDKWNDKIRGMI